MPIRRCDRPSSVCSQGDRDVFLRIRPAPDRNIRAPLKNHVVREKIRKPRLSFRARRGENQQENRKDRRRKARVKKKSIHLAVVAIAGILSESQFDIHEQWRFPLYDLDERVAYFPEKCVLTAKTRWWFGSAACRRFCEARRQLAPKTIQSSTTKRRLLSVKM